MGLKHKGEITFETIEKFLKPTVPISTSSEQSRDCISFSLQSTVSKSRLLIEAESRLTLELLCSWDVLLGRKFMWLTAIQYV